MWKVMQHRGLRSVFAANMISMLGSGLNAAAVTWTILQRTKSEMNLAYLVILMTIPAMLMMPFSGVVIDREDRRRLVMLLDAGRGLVIACVAVLALRHQVQLWHLYLMNTLVALGFWMFWPTITALIQELTPESEFVQSNTFLMAGVQGGWLIAGSIVGFLYNNIGLGGILVIDVSTYVVSFLLYFTVRKGRVVVARPKSTAPAHVEGEVAHFIHELKEGLHYIRLRPDVLLLGSSWALFLGAMLTQNITTAPLSDRVLKAGAVGYGWLNGAWGVGAFLSALYTPKLIAKFKGRGAVGISMAVLALGMVAAPYSRVIAMAAAIYLMMGSARGVGGIAITSSIMELVPKHMMGRVQNTFFFAGNVLQLCLSFAVGYVAHERSLAAAFAMIAALYAVASALTAIPVTSSISGTPGSNGDVPAELAQAAETE
jgi:MFS transporter, DHA3 family, macrolide efflux protein